MILVADPWSRGGFHLGSEVFSGVNCSFSELRRSCWTIRSMYTLAINHMTTLEHSKQPERSLRARKPICYFYFCDMGKIESYIVDLAYPSELLVLPVL